MSGITWMRHPEHGRMPCYGTDEVQRAKGYGWHVETEEEYLRLTRKVNGSPQQIVAVPVTATAVAAPEEPADDHEPIPEAAERAQLYALAEQRGIRVDRRWGLERLRKTVGD